MIIDALIVTYNPEIERFAKALESLRSQVSEIIIVDNGSENYAEIEKVKTENSVLIPLESNYGNAYAVNRGFEYAEKREVEFVILSDQDTVFKEDYAAHFEKVFLKNHDDKIAAYAPFVFDENINSILYVGVLKNDRIKNVVPENTMNVLHTIASGMIIDCKILANIGGMNEDIFVDMFDYEWCWKVNYLGYKILVLSELSINHKFGDKIITVLGKKLPLRSDLRYYFGIRNAIALSLKTKYLPKKGRFFLFIFGIEYFCGYFFLAKKKLLLLKAVIDGLKKKTGKIVIS